MANYPGAPRLVKGGIVLVNPTSGSVKRAIVLQYNPDSITRKLNAQTSGGDSGDRSEPLRLKGPPIETIDLEAVVDATDYLEFPGNHPEIVRNGIQPIVSALETVLYPHTERLTQSNQLAGMGTLEIAAMESDLTLFVWAHNRIVPVRITEISITEDAFDSTLNPIRASVSLSMRVLSVDDLGFSHKGGNMYMVYQAGKEALAGMYTRDVRETNYR